MVAIEPAPLRDGLYDRIGGWLVLPAISTYLTPVFMAYSAYDNLRFFSPSLSEAAQMIILAAGGLAIAQCIGWFYVCVLLSRLDAYFPRMFVIMSLANVAINVAMLLVLVAYTNGSLIADDARDAIRSLMQAIVWVPYMLISKRVKATFLGIRLPQKALIRYEPASAPSNLPRDGAFGQLREPERSPAERFKIKGHRLGIFVTLLSLVILAVGLVNSAGYPTPPWSSLAIGLGSIGAMFG